MAYQFTMTHHAQVERIDRIAACLEHLGFNEFILEVKEENRLYRLTDTGIIFVFGETGETLITGYMGAPLKISALYKRAGYTGMPPTVWKMVKRNQKLYAFLSEM